jgi:hypothetical protein
MARRFARSAEQPSANVSLARGPSFAVTLPIETTTLSAAAAELDLAVAAAEVCCTDPACAAPAAAWRGIAKAIPTLLS